MRACKSWWFVLVLALLPSTQTHAHAKLARSDPAARAVLAQAPAVIRLWFNERIEPAYSTAELQDAQGRVASMQKAKVSPDDPKLLLLPLPALPDGAYVVVYRVLSVDGHVVSARLRFTVRASPR